MGSLFVFNAPPRHLEIPLSPFILFLFLFLHTPLFLTPLSHCTYFFSSVKLMKSGGSPMKEEINEFNRII